MIVSLQLEQAQTVLRTVLYAHQANKSRHNTIDIIKLNSSRSIQQPPQAEGSGSMYMQLQAEVIDVAGLMLIGELLQTSLWQLHSSKMYRSLV